MTVDAEVFVIGAGPAGLTAAYCLTKEARSVIIIEHDPIYVGGISRTVDYNGFLFDIGGHRFFSKSKEVVALWQEILPDDFIARPRRSRIYYNGKFFSYPLKAFEALLKLGVFASAACMLSYAYAKAFPVAPARTFHDWVRNQFGERLFQIFFKTYTEKVWGMSCDEISADWAAQRIKGLDLLTAVVNGLKRSLHIGRKPKAGGATVKTLIESFQDPRPGRPAADGARAQLARIRRRQKSLAHRGRNRQGRARKLHRAPCHQLGAGARPGPADQAGADLAPACPRAALPRLSHRGADGAQGRAVSGQLDLHPRPQRKSRPGAELSLVVAGDGARRHELPRSRIFLLRGRRSVGCAGRRSDRARQKRSGADRPHRRRRCVRRLRGAPAQGLSGLRRRLSRQRRRHPARPRRQLPDLAPGRPQRHAQIQ